MGRLIDVSLPIAPDLLSWPGDPPIVIEPHQRIAHGDPSNVTLLSFGSHAGTHIDPPSHLIDGGASVDQIPPEVLIGPAWIADLSDSNGDPSAADLGDAGIPVDAERLLLKTPNSGRFAPGSPWPDPVVSLSEGAARWVVDRGVKLVAIDGLSIERAASSSDYPVHRTLLSAGIIILEGLDLSEVTEGPCELICLPLRLAGGDGAPARAFVRLS